MSLAHAIPRINRPPARHEPPPRRFPRNRRREPPSTPAGTLILIVDARSRLPAPPQARHGLSMTRPRPSHRGQVWAMLNMPRELMTWPRPPQVEQTLAVAPCSAPLPRQDSHVVLLRQRDFLFAPLRRFQERQFQVVTQIVPALGAALAACSPPPKRSSNMLEFPKTSRKMSAGSWNPPAGAGAGVKRRVAVLIVGGARLGIAQDFVGVAQFP